ncbi:hypothetical protein E4U56_004263 [Claviceps arundinis]|uniref:Uncharacterized protein n=1 Tax=Claviceps arundinis TaxID=1623583 RepID=A0A9P7SSU3_9HYPO|nr:hypothetical protein E4U56_004263 [Claviceps arundinis]
MSSLQQTNFAGAPRSTKFLSDNSGDIEIEAAPTRHQSNTTTIEEAKRSARQRLKRRGTTRPLDAEHVKKSNNVFKKDGLNRIAPENRLLCVCTAADIQSSTTYQMVW